MTAAGDAQCYVAKESAVVAMKGPRRILLAAAVVVGLLVVPGSPADAQSCQPGTGSDFDGDGLADIAIGDPDATVGGHERAGRVHVVYGDGSGSQTITQAASFVSGEPEAGDRFGFSLASVDYNGDGCSDLAVGVPYEAIGAPAEAGWVDVLFGSPTGFGPGGNLVFSQNTVGMPGSAEAGDRFGFSLAAGETTSGAPFLVIGVPGEDVDDSGGVSQDDTGAFMYVRGTTKLLVHQDSAGVFGNLEAGDQFGYSVAASSRHVAVGGPAEAVGTLAYSGTVWVFTHDVAAGTTGAWTQDEPGDSGVPEAGDWCGRSLAMTDYIPPGGSASSARSLLVVACPGEALEADATAGRIVTIEVTGSLNELASIHLEVDGVDGEAQPSDYFGWQAQVVNRTPGTAVTWRALLIAVGIPGEDSSGRFDNGGVQVLSAVGAPGDHDAWAPDHGMADAGWQRSSGGRLGPHLKGSSTHLYIADPYGATPAVYAIPWGNITDGATGAVRVYKPGADGLPTTGVGTFGGSIA